MNIHDYEYDESLGKWIIDTDPGVDDALAIILGLTLVKENILCLSVEGGNTGLEQCEINCKKLTEICQTHTPVYRGCAKNLTGVVFRAEDIHGGDGLYELEDFFGFEVKYEERVRIERDHHLIDNLSPLKIIEYCYTHENVNLLTIGPLTNIATAVIIDPNIVNLVNKIVIMGGSYTNSGNIVPCAEFNFACDPVACKVVFNHFKNIVVYGWEPSLDHLIKAKEAEHCIFDNDKSRFLKQVLIKKAEASESGVFPDYGAAVFAFFPFALKKSRKAYAEIAIDSTKHVNGALILADRPISNRSKCIEIIDTLHMEHFIGLFKKMIK